MQKTNEGRKIWELKNRCYYCWKTKKATFFRSGDCRPSSGDESQHLEGVKSLQKEGYAIEAVTNKGYALKKSPDLLSAAYIEQELRTKGVNLKVKVEKR